MTRDEARAGVKEAVQNMANAMPIVPKADYERVQALAQIVGSKLDAYGDAAAAEAIAALPCYAVGYDNPSNCDGIPKNPTQHAERVYLYKDGGKCQPCTARQERA
jgi:hypothetical protein